MYQIIESFHIISINTKYYIITYRKYPLVIQLQYYKDEHIYRVRTYLRSLVLHFILCTHSSQKQLTIYRGK